MTASEDKMAAEIAWLKKQLDALTGPVDQHLALRTMLRLSPQQAKIVALLLNTGRPLARSAIYAAVFEYPNGDGPMEKIVDVTLANIRRRLEDADAPAGIPGAYGSGCYAMAPQLRAWILERMPELQVAA